MGASSGEAEAALRSGDPVTDSRAWFEDAPVPMCVEDFSAIKHRLNELRSVTGGNLQVYLAAHPDELAKLISLVRLVSANLEAVRFFEVGSKEELRRVMPLFFQERSLGVFAEVLAGLEQGATRLDHEISIRTPSGTEKLVAISLRVSAGAEPTLASVVISFTDVTDRRRATQELKAHLDLESLVVELSGAFVNATPENVDQVVRLALEKMARHSGVNRASLFLLSEDLQTVTNTHEWCARPEDSQISLLQGIPFSYFGYHAKQLLAREVISLPRLSDYPEDARAERDWISKHGFRSLLFIPLLRQDKLVGTVGLYGEVGKECHWSPHFVRLLTFVGDMIVTVLERRRAEEALRQADRRKNEFLGLLSHELRNPLAPIRNSLHVLERVAPGSQAARRAQAVIARQVTHLTRLVDDLLDVTRITRGMIHLQRERLELGEVVRRTLDDHRATFEANGIELEDRLGSEPLWLNGDATRLAQVLGNLLGNAVKFTPRGGRVEVGLQREGPLVALRIKDNGVGITPEILGHLFEPFTQAPQALDRARGGLGLGLALVKGLVELHGGKVTITSKGLGQGTESTVWLPLEAAPEKMAFEAGPRPAGHHRVLVIEDNVDAADSLKEALELTGHEVQVAYDGPAGLAQAREFRPEFILCDIGLPGMSGYEVARTLRADEALRGTVLVALTGYTRPEDRRQAAESGFKHHVAKPPNFEVLERILSTAP